MILTEFNNGWGDDLPLRRFERELQNLYLKTVAEDQSRTVIINSTWYTQEYHPRVLAELDSIRPDRIILISMIDPAIPQREWYKDLCDDIWTMGYYSGEHEIDAWALIMDRYFQVHPDCEHQHIDTPYMCLNRKPHWHRRALYTKLQQLDLLDQGVVTMGDESGRSVRALAHDVQGSDLAPNAGPEQYGIANDIMTLGPADLWYRCFLNIVTETVFDIDQQWFVSEKIYKPVVGSRPFLIYAPNGGQKWLAHLGMESYVGDFTDISDHDPTQPDQIPGLLRDLSAQPTTYFRQKYLDLREKIAYNKKMFQEHIQQTWHRVNQGALCQT